MALFITKRAIKKELPKEDSWDVAVNLIKVCSIQHLTIDVVKILHRSDCRKF